jgi:glyoxylase-like metal-dependent hydrolase (beta-lactamase superfamily II)
VGLRTLVRNCLAPLETQVTLTDGEAQIAPGIRLFPIPGHTPGQVAVAARSEGEQLLYVSDAPVHPIHLEHPDWHLSVDVDPRMAAGTIRQICDRAHAARALVLAPHFAFPGLGHIVHGPDGWAWEPIAAA